MRWGSLASGQTRRAAPLFLLMRRPTISTRPVFPAGFVAALGAHDLDGAREPRVSTLGYFLRVPPGRGSTAYPAAAIKNDN